MENVGPDAAAATSSSQPQPPLLRLSSLPAFTLPKHLRHPSNPPPTGPLPRPPSFLENKEIATRLSASSPPLSPSSSRPRLVAYPFPTIVETKSSSSSHLSPHHGSTPKSSSTNQLSPSDSSSDSSPNNNPGLVSISRQLSAHTQASSDALGENDRPSLPFATAALPQTSDQNVRKSSTIGTDSSGYSHSSLLASYEDTGPDKPISASNFDQSVVSLGDPQQDSRSISRLSRLSYISGGAAFIVSEESDGLQGSNGRSYRINNVLPDFEAQAAHPARPNPHDLDDRRDIRINSILGSPRDPNLRIHPADNRFEHTYRMRRASEAQEPIYVPVYSFEPPGRFPDRSRLTAPLATPKFLNHTPRNFSLPGRTDVNLAPRSSSDSAEMLLGNTGKFDGIDKEIRIPPKTYDAQGRSLRPFRNYLTGRPSVTLNQPNQGPIGGNGQLFGKETARQRFERERSRYFHDLDQLEKSQWPEAPVSLQAQIHGPKRSFSKYGIPTLGRPEESYTGGEINESRWPERYKRQKRIGRSLLCLCAAMPPLWLVMAVGLLDNLVAEMTGGDIWAVGRSEKVLAAWLGGTFCFALIATIIAVGIAIL